MQRGYFLALMLIGLLSVATTRADQGPPQDLPTPPRLSLIEGQVSFWRPGGEDWAPARPNTPLANGDSIYTGPSSNAELQVGPRSYVRIGEATQLQVSSVEPDFLQIKVTGGEASLDLRQLLPGHAVEVDTPNAAFTVEHVGYYRFNVTPQSTALITRRGGSAQLAMANGQSARVSAAEEVVVTGTDSPRLESYAAPDLDAWDQWNYSRTDRLLDSMSARYVPPEVYGAGDLDHSGNWRTVPEYGAVWIPDAVPAGWAPYSTGRWIYDPLFGWSWIDDAPWGWAPYHYGRWVYVNGYWGWTPGPIVPHPVYAPALVAWLGGVRISAGVGVGWVALGWGEPLLPWWGPRQFVGVPYWGGWGGPRVVNRTVINTTTVNVTNINVTNITYANTQVHNAVIATSADHLSHAGRDYVRVEPEEVRDLRPAARGVEVRPSAASLAPGTGHAAQPPQEYATRAVVATRAPRDPSSWLHDAGLKPTENNGPAPRLVSPENHVAVAPQQDLANRGEASEHAQLTPSSVSGRPQAEASPAATANRAAAVERMRPPPPPSFNEWRGQQARMPEARAQAAPVSTPPQHASASTQASRGPEPTAMSTERHNLPGEPAMKLRTPAAGSTSGHSREGNGNGCKERECR